MKRNDDYLLRTVGDIGVLVPTAAFSRRSAKLVRLNPTAICIWHLLADDLTSDELARALALRLSLPEPVVACDVRHFIDAAIAGGLVRS
jgi:hypothetical protein